jgi:tetratricopeptide (TPR) repeat protein
MYYRYRSNKGSNRYLKIISIIVFIIAVVVLLYNFRSSIQFWRYSYNSIIGSLIKVEQVIDKSARLELLAKIQPEAENYAKDNPFSSESYYALARVTFLKGEAMANIDIISYVVGSYKVIDPDAVREFEKSMKMINKGLCFESHTSPPDEILVLQAKSFFYTNYYEIASTQKLLESVRNPRLLKSVDDRRFYGLMKIIGGNADDGVQYLLDYGDIKNEANGRLFLASAYYLAKQNTNAIIEYKSIIDNNSDLAIVLKARIGLGNVYYTQSLGRDAVIQFEEADKIDSSNQAVRLMLARSYLLSGDKVKAKPILEQILASDKQNMEVQDLIKSIH